MDFPNDYFSTLDQSFDPTERSQLTQNLDGVPTYKNHSVTDPDPYADRTSASDTLTGATSAEVNDSIGHPVQGQTSNEVRHDGQKHRKKHGVGGAEQWGPTSKGDLKAHPDERQRDVEIDREE